MRVSSHVRESIDLLTLVERLTRRLAKATAVFQSSYAASNIHSEHMQSTPAHTYTLVHTTVPQTREFVHTERVDTCIAYMYRLAFRASQAALTPPVRLFGRSLPRTHSPAAATAAGKPLCGLCQVDKVASSCPDMG